VKTSWNNGIVTAASTLLLTTALLKLYTLVAQPDLFNGFDTVFRVPSQIVMLVAALAELVTAGFLLFTTFDIRTKGAALMSLGSCFVIYRLTAYIAFGNTACSCVGVGIKFFGLLGSPAYFLWGMIVFFVAGGFCLMVSKAPAALSIEYSCSSGD